MKNFPRISIVTPSFNQGKFIEQTIQSVLDQNYPNLEFIIIDGGSQDNTVEIIRKYEKHIAFWISEPDKGQTHALNKGFAKCTGEVFNWLNSDDYLAPNSLQLIGEAFQNPKVDVFSGKVNNFFDDSELTWQEQTEIIPNQKYLTLVKKCNRQPGTFFRKSKLEQIFPLPDQLNFLMDQFMWYSFILLHDIDGIHSNDEILVHFRRHSNSKTMSNNSNFRLGYNDQFFDELNSIFNFFHNEFEDVLNKFCSKELKVINHDILNCIQFDKEKLMYLYLVELLKSAYFREEYPLMKSTFKNLKISRMVNANFLSFIELFIKAYFNKEIKLIKKILS